LSILSDSLAVAFSSSFTILLTVNNYEEYQIFVASKESVVIKSYELAKYITKFSVPQQYPSWHEKKAKAWQRCHCFCISKVHTSFRTHQKDSSNAESNLRIENLTVLRLDKRKINRKELDVVVFVSDTYRTSVTEVPELYAVGRYISGKSEGPRDFFFDQETAAGAEGQNPNPMPDEVIRIFEEEHYG
jgi:hypothetical protein